MKPVLEINALKKYYGKPANPTKALDGITFQVMAGEFLGIMGSSGSGKSTLLNCIATVIRPDSGSIIMNGASVLKLKGAALAGYRGRQIGYLFQNFELLDNLTGKENILLPLSIQNVPEKESCKRLHSLADYLEIRDVLDKFPAQMSGGQKQRVAAARALILTPGIILADEPTGALDSRNAKSLMEKLSGLNQDKNTTILMVTHGKLLPEDTVYPGRHNFSRTAQRHGSGIPPGLLRADSQCDRASGRRKRKCFIN